PKELSVALAGAVGCPAADLKDQGFPRVECKPPEVVSGLSSTVHWPLSRLRGPLREIGVDSLEIHVTHGSGNGRITPAMESTHGLFGRTHSTGVSRGDLENASLENVD